MKLSHFFIDRPIFASVLSLVVLLVGAITLVGLPIAQYADIAPPTIVVRASYPGATAETAAATVATPLEQEINGVENMLYMSSYAAGDGSITITITFRVGTNLDMAQVLVQNRVAVAEPKLPDDVRRLGITTRKSSPDLMMVVHMLSPDDTYDQLYISNYALVRVRDVLMRLDGVGDLTVFGAREFSLRVWLDPDKLAAYGLASSDVVSALREQNVQVSGGSLGQMPAASNTAFQLDITTQGRLADPEQFRQVIVKSGQDGRLIRVGDVARVEMGAKEYVTNSYLDGKPAVALAIYQRPGSNALEGARDVIRTMDRLKADFPAGLAYRIVYNPTEFIAASVSAVEDTIFKAVALVVLVIIAFLHSWRASIIPIISIPVSLIGTCAIMGSFGFSLNTLTLFGLVLAVGIVVDDAIVVVENVERNIAAGLSPRDAAHETMDEVGTAVIAIALVLMAVFLPTAFIPGISGQFYRQFALTIASATLISAFNSLTLSPALCALLLKPHSSHPPQSLISRLLWRFGHGFNRTFDRIGSRYSRLVNVIVRRRVVMLAIFGGLLVATVHLVQTVPRGFIPTLDQGYCIVVIQLPDGASLNRTDAVTQRASEIIAHTPGVTDAVAFAGFSGATFTNASNAGVVFAKFAPFDDRLAAGQSAGHIISDLIGRLQVIQDAFIIAVPPPPVRGIGSAGGFKLEVEDHTGGPITDLVAAANHLVAQARTTPGLAGVYTTFSANTPQLYLDIDRVKAEMLNVPISNIFDALQVNLGSSYVNDFNAYGRIYQVRAQADENFRVDPETISRLKVRSATGALVPLGTLVTIVNVTGPDLVQRYNMFTAVPVQGNAAPGVSSEQALTLMEKLAAETLPPGMSIEWTDLAFQQKSAADSAGAIFGLSVLFVFLVLAAQYESWALPLSIILIVPMSVLSAMIGVLSRGLDNNILVQVGLVVLVGLAAKNAILIVEFARQNELDGHDTIASVVQACRTRLRPILMTALAFVLGVLPLVLATGPGAEMRQSLGTAVFSGMLGVTLFGLILTPVFFVVIRALTRRAKLPTGTLPALHKAEE